MKKCVSAVRTGVCYLSHLSVLIVTLLGWNIRKEYIRKINCVRKSLSKPDDLRSQAGANLSLTGNHTLAACDCREVVA